MTDNLNGWRFERGLDRDFMKKLRAVAIVSGWFADVLADPDLILGIRKNYVNVYRQGQSLFKIERNGPTGPLKFSTHPKYLVDPRLSKAVIFDGSVFQVGGHKALTTDYGPETLNLMKRAAKLYSGDEKEGVHAVARANPNVIDTEVAFNCEAEEEENNPFTPRIDLACFEDVKGQIRLRFWEAKLYSNPEIRAAGDTVAPVVEQVRGYRDLIKKHREKVLDSYRRVAGNLDEMARWVDSPKKVGELVQRVAAGEPLTIDGPPFVGLIVYGYDDAQGKSERWETHLGKLKKAEILVRSAGNAKNIKLRGGDLD
jgi:hypothetical protein